MSNQLFEKVICFTDCHFGLRNNSAEHNQDIMNFLDWMISEGHSRGADTCIFLGDWQHHRSNINLLTLNFTMQALRKLNAAFKKTYIIVGNHDLFYREKRDIHSMIVCSEFSNIVLVDHPVVIDDVAFVPWLVEDEWKAVSKIDSKYIFGHLELPGFKMNAMIEMHDTGKLNSTHFEKQDHVFSGHFHMRQTKGKVSYIGNPFGHNYSDAWDFNRGAMFLEWGKEPEFLDYTDGPRFISISFSSLIENPDLYIKPKTYMQVIFDSDITYEESMRLREELLSEYSVREFKIVRTMEDILGTEVANTSEIKTVDEIVMEGISALDVDWLDPALLSDIYLNL